MSGGTLGLTLIALVTVVIIPGIVGAMTGVRRSSGLVRACLAAAAIAVIWAVYWITAGHVKHTILFAGLAVVALIGASFSRRTEAEAPVAQ